MKMMFNVKFSLSELQLKVFLQLMFEVQWNMTVKLGDIRRENSGRCDGR